MTNRRAQVLPRRSFDAIRGVDTPIWTLIHIGVVGLRPLAVAPASASSDMAAFARLFSEALEATEANASEGVRPAGGRRRGEVASGLLPQLASALIAMILATLGAMDRIPTRLGLATIGTRA